MPDFTGELGNKLTAISDKLIAAVPGIEGPIIAELHEDIAALIQAEKDGISQAGAVIQADLAPALDESRAWRAAVKDLLTTGIVGSIGGIPFVVKAATASPSDTETPPPTA